MKIKIYIESNNYSIFDTKNYNIQIKNTKNNIELYGIILGDVNKKSDILRIRVKNSWYKELEINLKDHKKRLPKWYRLIPDY